MELSPSVVETSAEAYPDVQPLWAVEEEHLEILPSMFERGAFGWRDAEWVVQWFFRRFLGGYPERERQAVESAYSDNSYEAVETAISTAVGDAETATKLDALTGLNGVDNPVASAFLQFCQPDRYLVLSEREWSVLQAGGKLERPYPESPTQSDYETYLTVTRQLASDCDCSLWRLYQALWVLGEDKSVHTETR